MADEPSFVVTVDWAASMATVAIPGELDFSTCELLTERLAWIMESHPRRVVLDLAGVDDRFSEQALALVAAARLQLPRNSLLSVRSASTAVRRYLELAGWRGTGQRCARGRFPARAGRGERHRWRAERQR